MFTGSLDQWAIKFRVSFGRPNWCTNVLETEAQSARVAGLNLLFALISSFFGEVLSFPLSYQYQLIKTQYQQEDLFPRLVSREIENSVENWR